MYIGIDIGGTHIRAVMFSTKECTPVDVRHSVRHAVMKRLPNSQKALEKSLIDLITEVSYGKKISGIGIGLPGVLDYKRGILVQSGNIPYLKKWNAKKFFSQFGGLIKIDNDSRCFLRAEAKLGAGRGYKNIFGISIGTGIGGGVMINGKIDYGAHKRAGEVGHMVLRMRQGSRITEQTFQELGAKKAFEKYGNRSTIIGIGVADVINILDPEIVILGGGGGLSKKLNLTTVRRVANSYLRPPLRGKTKIVKGKIGEYAGAIGAGLLFNDHGRRTNKKI